MAAPALALIPEKDVSTTFTKRFFDLQKIARSLEKRSGGSAASLQKLVQPLMSHVTKGEIGKAEPKAFVRFVEEACRVVRAVAVSEDDGAHQSSGAGSAPSVGMECSAWLCSLAAAGPTSEAVVEAARTWLCSALVSAGSRPFDEPEQFIDALVGAVGVMPVPQSEAARLGQVEYVLLVARSRSLGKATSDESLNHARQWCRDLLGTGTAPIDMKDAAKALGVPLPEEPRGGTDWETKTKAFTPVIFALPPVIPSDQLQAAWEACLTSLLGVPVDDLVTEQTARQVRELNPETRYQHAAATMYFAARDIWDAYWKTGVKDNLPAARQFVEFAYAVQKTHRGDPRYRANSLHLLLNLQLPELRSR